MHKALLFLCRLFLWLKPHDNTPFSFHFWPYLANSSEQKSKTAVLYLNHNDFNGGNGEPIIFWTNSFVPRVCTDDDGKEQFVHYWQAIWLHLFEKRLETPKYSVSAAHAQPNKDPNTDFNIIDFCISSERLGRALLLCRSWTLVI